MQNQRHFNHNPNKLLSFTDQSKQFRRNLIHKSSEIEKKWHHFGKVLTLTLNPTYFLSTCAGGFFMFDASLPYVKSIFYSEGEWFKEHTISTKTQHAYHPAYKNLCPVLRNAPKNPILLTSQPDSNTQSAVYISKIVLTQFKDNSVNYNFETQRAILDDGHLSITQTQTYSLAFDSLPACDSDYDYYNVPARHGVTLRINGNVTTRADDLITMIELLCGQFLYKAGYSLHKSYAVFHRHLDNNLSHWLSYRSLSHVGQSIGARMRGWYQQLKAHPEFYDLPFNEIELLNLYNDVRGGTLQVPVLANDLRARILAPLRAGDTIAAINACFYGFSYPKSIKKLLLKTGLLTYPKYVYDAIDSCIKKIGVDKTLLFITDVNKAGEPDFVIIGNAVLLEPLKAGFNINTIKHLQKQGSSKKVITQLYEKFRYIEDTMFMYERLVEDDVPLVFASRNINHVHNYLSNLYTFHSNIGSDAEMRAMKAFDTSKQSQRYEAGEYIIRSPYTAAELVKVGSAMSHCVAIYIEKFYYRQIDILLLTSTDDKYLACIEVFNGHVIQAKLKYDKRLHNNTKYLAVVMDYVRKHNLKPSTIDLGDDYPVHKLTNTLLPYKDKERLNAVSVFEKKL